MGLGARVGDLGFADGFLGFGVGAAHFYGVLFLSAKKGWK